MRMNHQMQDALLKAGIQLSDGLELLYPLLRNMVDSGVIEVEGCFFLRSLLPEGSYDVNKAFEEDDRTGLECSINNIYIQSIIYPAPYTDTMDETDVLSQGVYYAHYLAQKLNPLGVFRVILSYAVDDESGKPDCSVRFHLLRAGETWLSENLEDYREEAVMVL